MEKSPEETTPLITGSQTYSTTRWYKWIYIIASSFLVPVLISVPFASTGLTPWITAWTNWPQDLLVSLNFGGFLIFNAATVFVLSVYVEPIGPRRIGIFGSVGYMGSFGLMSVAFRFDQMWLYCVAFSACLGVSMSACYLSVYIHIGKWLVQRRGLAGSIIGFGIASGTIMYIELLYYLRDSLEGYQMMLVLGGAGALTCLVFCWMDLPPVKNTALQEITDSQSEEKDIEQMEEVVPTRLVVLKTPQFWILFFLVMIGLTPGYGNLPSIDSAFKITTGNSTAVSEPLNFYTSIVISGYAGGRLLLGPFADVITVKIAVKLYLLIQAISLGLSPFLKATSINGYLSVATIQLFFFGGSKVLVPALIKQYANEKAYSVVVSLALCGAAPAGALGTVLHSFVSYDVFCYFMVGLCVVGIVISFFARPVTYR